MELKDVILYKYNDDRTFDILRSNGITLFYRTIDDDIDFSKLKRIENDKQ